DSLLQPATQRRQILLMPTWRAYIVTRKASGEADNKQDAAFMQTEYAKAWKSFLGHHRLRNLHERYGFDFVFIPHPILRVFLSKFELPEFIQVPEGEECNYQALFRSSAALITDYSSVAFDMAFLQKAILYYQFDEKVFFSGEHMLQRGYFDYRRDGFGPVLTVEDKLFEELELLFQRDGRPEACYLERMQKTFAFRDGKNCERVFQAILELDKEGACG
uniref:CDP-glycerol glycerophosphotransferase family protein n=1 Tax=Mailhella sp. TaxID=1981029 RepID=UPI004062A3EB